MILGFSGVAGSIKQGMSLAPNVLMAQRVASLKSNSMGNHAVKMLLYDWSSDPLFHNDEEGRKKLMLEQARALRNYFGGGHNLKVVLRDFVWESGLLEKVAKTFMLEKSDFEEIKKQESTK